MAVHSPWLGIGSLGALLITIATGCTVSIQPWTKAPPYPPTELPNHPVGPVGSWAGTPGGPANLTSAYVDMQLKLIREEELRKSSDQQIKKIAEEAKEKDSLISKAHYEIAQTSKLLNETKQDSGRAILEINSLKERVKMLEENRVGILQTLNSIEMFLRSEKMNASFPQTPSYPFAPSAPKKSTFN